MGSLRSFAVEQQHNMLNSSFRRILDRAGIRQTVLWDRQGTRVIKYSCRDDCQLQLLAEEMAEAPSVVLKVWTAHRVQRDDGNLQVSDALWTWTAFKHLRHPVVFMHCAGQHKC
jgi:hypothetical protein